MPRTYETPDGVFPSVTSILSVIAKPELVNWAAGKEREMVVEAACRIYGQHFPTAMGYRQRLLTEIGMEKAHDKIRQTSLDVGSSVHKLIEWMLRKELGIMEAGERPRITEGGEAAFAAFQRWQTEQALEPKFVETVVWSKRYEYAGTADALMFNPSGGLVLVDFKTSKAIYEEYALQVAAYLAAWNEMGHEQATQAQIVRIPKEAADALEVLTLSAAECKDLLWTFVNVLEVWKWNTARTVGKRVARASR